MIIRCPIRFLFCLAVLMLWVQFATPAVAQFEKRLYHPRPESIPEATDPSLVIDLSDLEKWDELPPFIDTTGFKTVVFGREDGEDYETARCCRRHCYRRRGHDLHTGCVSGDEPTHHNQDGPRN